MHNQLHSVIVVIIPYRPHITPRLPNLTNMTCYGVTHSSLMFFEYENWKFIFCEAKGVISFLKILSRFLLTEIAFFETPKKGGNFHKLRKGQGYNSSLYFRFTLFVTVKEIIKWSLVF